ncbi:MAG: response regulator transcription factor [Nitrospira sp.]|nr:response regulator transcription factor [Nitrospira sp.]
MTDTMVPALTIAIISSYHVVSLGLQQIFESRETPRFLVHPYQRMTPDVLLPEHRPDVVILDMETERDVIGAIKLMREAAPKIKILSFSGFEDKERMREAIEYGVDGVILKVQPPKVVLAAIDALYSPFHNDAFPERNGTRFASQREVSKIHPTTETRPAVWPDALTEREREVIGLVRQGLSNKDIAYQLSISDSTVRHHLTSIFDKVGVSNRQKLLVHAHHIGSTPD